MTLVNPTLAAYNNLPGFPPEPKLGDLLNAMQVPNPDYVALTTPVEIEIYVEDTGSDTTGDGTAANPYRQVDRAIGDFLNADLPATSVVNIYVGAGNFAVPVLGRFIPTNILVTVFGNLTNPVYEGPAAAGALVATYNALWEVGVGAYAAVIDDDSHWILVNFQDNFPSYSAFAAPVAASTSPDIRYTCAYDATSFDTFGVYPYETVFVDTDFVLEGNFPIQSQGSSANQNYDPSYGPYGFKIIGVAFAAGGDARFVNANLQGCRLGTTGLGTELQVLHSVLACRIPDMAVYATDSSFPACLMSVVAFYPSSCLFYGTVENGVGSTWFPYNTFRATFVDFRVTGQTALYPYGGALLELYALTVYGGSIIDTEGSPNVSIDATPTVAGQFSGEVTGAFAVRLRQGSQAVNLEAACASGVTNTSTPGADIVVGGNAVVAWAALPTTDAVAVSPQFCRAT